MWKSTWRKCWPRGNCYTSGLEQLKIPYIESQANFVLGQVGERAVPIRDELRERGVLVRDRSYELPGYLRFTVGTRDQIGRLLDELERIW